jgi:hypothetical protein
MSPKSHTLFHFTKSKDVLQSILKNGFWPRYCQEDVSWLAEPDFEYISYPMVCFCDIPLSRISEHVGFYGGFGIGMSRSWAEQNGLNPITYVSGRNNVATQFRMLNVHANQLENKEKMEAAKVTMRYLFAHTKPTKGRMVINGAPVEKQFYQESEWRYVPIHKNIEEYLYYDEHNNASALDKANKATRENCLLKFVPSDVRYIFVSTDADIPGVINFIQTELDGYPAADLKILMSRVVSLESIQVDL